MGDLIEEWATQVAEAELSTTLPRRWAQTQGVAERAIEVGQVLGGNAGLLVAAAATLHDFGYAPRLAVITETNAEVLEQNAQRRAGSEELATVSWKSVENRARRKAIRAAIDAMPF